MAAKQEFLVLASRAWDELTAPGNATEKAMRMGGVLMEAAVVIKRNIGREIAGIQMRRQRRDQERENNNQG